MYIIEQQPKASYESNKAEEYGPTSFNLSGHVD